MSKKKYLYILAIFLASIATEAIAQKTLPPVVSTAPKVGGGTVLCRGSDCAGVLAALYWDEKGSDLQLVMDPLFRDRNRSWEDVCTSESEAARKLQFVQSSIHAWT
ncbi:MAG TPA: hypothetical protein VGE12_08825 [Noviherbaspirillum sp.]